MIKLIDSEEKLNNALNADVKNVDSEEIVFNLNLDKYTEPVTRALMRCVEKYIEAGYNPVLKLKVNGLDYTIDDFENLLRLENQLSLKGVKIGFLEYTEEYSIEESLDAFLKCKDYADYVNATNASPFEKYLMIYRYLTSMVYKENFDNPLKARQLISVMNTDDIVCVGYSKLMKFLCNAVGIKCETQMLRVHTKSSGRVGVHQNNIIYLKDEKYGIDGYYYADSCWDSVKRKKEPFMKYNYALLPLEDVKHLRDKKMEFYPETSALYDDKFIEEILLSADARRECVKKFDFKFKKIQLPEFFREANSTGSKIAKVTNVVKQIFLDNGIPADYLSKKYRECSPTCFYPELFITLLLVEPPEMEMFNYYLDQLKNYIGKQVAVDENVPFTKYQHSYGYEDIYKEFDDFANGDFNFNIWDVSDYYEALEFTRQFNEFITAARLSSVPISSEIMERAIKESLIKEGCDEEYAANEAARAMVYSQKRSEKIFDQKANNCFIMTAIEKRKTNGRIY